MANTRFINITKARRLMHPSRRISSLIANIINPNTGKIVKACVGLNPAININYNRRSYSKDYCINTLGSDMEYMQDVFCRGIPEHQTTLKDLELDSPNVVPIRKDGVLLGAYHIMGGVIK